VLCCESVCWSVLSVFEGSACVCLPVCLCCLYQRRFCEGYSVSDFAFCLLLCQLSCLVILLKDLAGDLEWKGQSFWWLQGLSLSLSTPLLSLLYATRQGNHKKRNRQDKQDRERSDWASEVICVVKCYSLSCIVFKTKDPQAKDRYFQLVSTVSKQHILLPQYCRTCM
jgi:hypothetical protein